jgi:DnaJ-class molecular chaperone
MSTTVVCPDCRGTGTCTRCGGSGGGDTAESRCPDCRGTGDCRRCAGEGSVEAEPDKLDSQE